MLPFENPESGNDHVPFEEVVAFEKLDEMTNPGVDVPEKTTVDVPNCWLATGDKIVGGGGITRTKKTTLATPEVENPSDAYTRIVLVPLGNPESERFHVLVEEVVVVADEKSVEITSPGVDVPESVIREVLNCWLFAGEVMCGVKGTVRKLTTATAPVEVADPSNA